MLLIAFSVLAIRHYDDAWLSFSQPPLPPFSSFASFRRFCRFSLFSPCLFAIFDAIDASFFFRHTPPCHASRRRASFLSPFSASLSPFSIFDAFLIFASCHGWLFRFAFRRRLCAYAFSFDSAFRFSEPAPPFRRRFGADMPPPPARMPPAPAAAMRLSPPAFEFRAAVSASFILSL